MNVKEVKIDDGVPSKLVSISGRFGVDAALVGEPLLALASSLVEMRSGKVGENRTSVEILQFRWRR